MRLIVRLLILFVAVSTAPSFLKAKDVSSVLRHSAVAELNAKHEIDLHTTDNDAIEVTLQNVGGDEVIFNGVYKLTLIKREDQALFYEQSLISGLVIWVYFPRDNIITYAKLRAFPVTELPSSYLMIARCK